MSVLESIRKRSTLLVGIIFAALFIFVLEDALTSGRSFFGGNKDVVAVVNGKNIKYSDFQKIAEEAVAKKKLSLGAESLNDSITNATQEAALEDMVFHQMMESDFKKLGINVSDSELHDLMLGPNPARDVYEFFSDHRGHLDKQFQDPRTGGLNTNAVIAFLQKATEQQQMQWAILEDQLKTQDLKYKYFNLLLQGLFVTDAMAKQVADDGSKTYDISYALKRYTDIPDNSVTVSDQDINDYYTKHLYEYKQENESRKLDYVTFYYNPTKKDMDSLKKEVDSIYSQLKNNKNLTDDSLTIANSDALTFDGIYHKPSELSGMIDSIMTNSEVGTVYGPYKEDNKLKIAKLLDVAELPDSVKVSDIIIQAPNGDFDKVKALADSLKDSANADNFAELAQRFSADPSKDKAGDLGWFYRKQGGLNPDIEHACFFGKKGDITILKENFGYIILLITEQSEKEKCYKVGIAAKNILPGSTTRDSVYAIASNFAGKNKVSADFEKMATQMNTRTIDVGENDKELALENSREVIRWAYNSKEGDVSDPINEGETQFIVLHLMQVTAKGTIPLAQVKEQVKLKVLNEKKAEKIMDELSKEKLRDYPSTAKGLTFESYSIPGLGKEDAVIGTMSAMNAGATSNPIQGELGVYVIHIDSTYMAETPNYMMEQQKLTQGMRYKAQNELYQALLKNAGFVDHLGRYH